MSKFMIESGKISTGDFDFQNLDPQFRKASNNMIMAATALQNIFAQAPHLQNEQTAVLLATHFGELESTLEFHFAHRELKIARPVLFQNSLHNSTLGFVSIHFGLKGPGMTISADEYTEQAVIETAKSFLKTHAAVVVCFVDYIPETLVESYLRIYPFLKSHLNHAKAYAFSNEKFPSPSREIGEEFNDFSFTNL